ncbi:hypothetical protein C2S52_003574 [Perilla frutescens var. hirtella]|uniref:Uncharacterized protein n=1 Tax=Perilla frutescens var. hirtella TaxID=608512 RepID=A0AAD4J1X0_PERFH|nr:hypothetical protein C2S52_003574 [Perilla frutescens var. hirtella]KAH6825616.1 hypothetical protein C2S53_017588 [Perilla frutescens var. hirtella]
MIIAFVHPTLSDEAAEAPVPEAAADFQIKKTDPVFFNKRNGKRNIVLRKRFKRDRMAADARRFSAMLPKGYVPPSGSSPCHNVYPNSVSFFCDFSTHEMHKP